MPGRAYLHLPGPTLVPERIVRAMSEPLIDHRGPKFAALIAECLKGLQSVYRTERGRIVIFPGSGTGAWEAAIVNTLSPGDRVLACVNGFFSSAFARTAAAHRIDVQELSSPWTSTVPGEELERRLAEDADRRIRAVLAVHNETSTGVTNDIAAIRGALDRARHPALLLIDVVSSLASIDLRFDEWGIDVALTGPQKGLMLPPGMAILAVSEKALRASEKAKCPRAYWDWAPVLERNQRGECPYTPPTSLLLGLRESLVMIAEEGLANVFARHARFAEASRRAVRALGLGVFCESAADCSNTVTAIRMPDGFDSDAYIAHALSSLQISLGVGLGPLKGKIFRIGHLGSLNEMDVIAALAGVELTLKSFGVDIPIGAGLAAAERSLLESR